MDARRKLGRGRHSGSCTNQKTLLYPQTFSDSVPVYTTLAVSAHIKIVVASSAPNQRIIYWFLWILMVETETATATASYFLFTRNGFVASWWFLAIGPRQGAGPSHRKWIQLLQLEAVRSSAQRPSRSESDGVPDHGMHGNVNTLWFIIARKARLQRYLEVALLNRGMLKTGLHLEMASCRARVAWFDWLWRSIKFPQPSNNKSCARIIQAMAILLRPFNLICNGILESFGYFWGKHGTSIRNRTPPKSSPSYHRCVRIRLKWYLDLAQQTKIVYRARLLG